MAKYEYTLHRVAIELFFRNRELDHKSLDY